MANSYTWFGVRPAIIILVVFLLILVLALLNSYWFWGKCDDDEHGPLETRQYDWNFILLIWVGLILILMALALSYVNPYNYALAINIFFFGGLLIILAGIIAHFTAGKSASWKWPDEKSSSHDI